jgi:hypothetical protein
VGRNEGPPDRNLDRAHPLTEACSGGGEPEAAELRGRAAGAERLHALSCGRLGTRGPEAVDREPCGETAIAQAVLRTVAYADVFDHPLTLVEAHRYLVGVTAPQAAVREELQRLVPERLTRREGFYMLRGRGDLVETRRRRAVVAAQLWPEAVRHGRMFAQLPFVRMVAVTGALTRDNVEPDSDIDYLVATAPGRVWVGRGLTGLVRRAVRRRGIRLCPNYVLSEEALSLEERNLVTAYELVQMVPLAGHAVYRRMRQLNDWTADFLPNAGGCPRWLAPVPPTARRVVRLAEAVLRTPIGGWMERMEWTRFERKLPARSPDPKEVIYSADCFKDHVDGWGERIRAAYAERILALGVEP